jgi:hypothetical protein
MNKIIVDCEQGTDQWFGYRYGIPTASRFSQIVTTKGAPSDSRKKLMYLLAGERILGRKEETYQSFEMAKGSAMEPEACAVFEMMQEVEVNHVGFAFYDDRQDRGGSVDGLIGDDTILEIKCPSLSVQIQYLLDGKLPTTYFQQCQGYLYIYRREKLHFFSYYPEFAPLHLLINRDEKFITALDRELDLFCAELEEVVIKLKQLNNT